MTLTINDTTMTSDQSPHTARQAPGREHAWEVSWLPGQVLDRNSAITAMILADTGSEHDLREGHRLWPFIQSWAAELGLTGPDAIARAGQPPAGPERQHHRDGERPDPERRPVTSQPARRHRPGPRPGGPPRPAPGPAPPEHDTAAAASQAGKDPAAGRLAYSVEEAARLTGLSRDLLYDQMRRGNLTYIKVGRRRLITRQHLNQFLGIAS